MFFLGYRLFVVLCVARSRVWPLLGIIRSSHSSQLQIYTVQNLYGTKFLQEKKAIISLEFNGPSLLLNFT
jgi:hypothetical protein